MEKKFMQRAIELARYGMDNNEGGPFGCVVVKNGEIVAEGNNRVTTSNDPTAHAEVVAIRNACEKLGTFQLTGCEVYTSCEPCPMCLGAIYWARPSKVYFAATKDDAADAGFDDSFIYEELELPADQKNIPLIPLERDAAVEVFEIWKLKEDKVEY